MSQLDQELDRIALRCLHHQSTRVEIRLRALEAMPGYLEESRTKLREDLRADRERWEETKTRWQRMKDLEEKEEEKEKEEGEEGEGEGKGKEGKGKEEEEEGVSE